MRGSQVVVGYSGKPTETSLRLRMVGCEPGTFARWTNAAIARWCAGGRGGCHRHDLDGRPRLPHDTATEAVEAFSATSPWSGWRSRSNMVGRRPRPHSDSGSTDRVTQFALWLGSRWIGPPDQDDRADPFLWAVWRETSLATGWGGLLLVTAVASVLMAAVLGRFVADRLLILRILFTIPVFCLVAVAVHGLLIAVLAMGQKRAKPFAILNLPSAAVDLALLSLVALVWIGTYLAGIYR